MLNIEQQYNKNVVTHAANPAKLRSILVTGNNIILKPTVKGSWSGNALRAG